MLFALTAIIMAIGMVGIVAPFVPGLILMWVAALVYGVGGEFQTVGAICFGVITALTIIGEAAGFFLPSKAANEAGAPMSSIAIGALGGAIGFFVVPVFGFLIGGILGVFLAEFLRNQDTTVAWRTTMSTLIGFGVAALAQLVAAILIVITWLVWVVAT